MTKKYKVNWAVRLSNAMVTALLRAGIPVGAMTLLTVKGRKSGVMRTIPVAIGEHDGQRWLISPFGEVSWVHNLRASGRATLTRGRRSQQVIAVELAPNDAAPLLKQSLASAPSFVRSYFDATPDSSVDDFRKEAERHPVFRLDSAAASKDADRSRESIGRR